MKNIHRNGRLSWLSISHVTQALTSFAYSILYTAKRIVPCTHRSAILFAYVTTCKIFIANVFVPNERRNVDVYPYTERKPKTFKITNENEKQWNPKSLKLNLIFLQSFTFQFLLPRRYSPNLQWKMIQLQYKW